MSHTSELRIIALEARLAALEAFFNTDCGTATMVGIDPNVLYTANEAGELMRCGKTNVYDLWESGELAVINIGKGKKGKRVRGSAIIAFMESREEGGPVPMTTYKHLKMGR